MSLRKAIKRVVHPVLKPAAEWYFSKPRAWKYHDLKVMVNPGVFHPHLTISTRQLLDYLNGMDLVDKKLLELGCGCGAVSVFCARKGADVTASDIHQDAVNNAQQNADAYDLKMDCITSDLFQNLQGRQWDLMVINPPYYPANPKDMPEHAWYCGEEFEYFKELFATAGSHLNPGGSILMILSEDCALGIIMDIAEQGGFSHEIVMEKRVAAEGQFIYKLQPQ